MLLNKEASLFEYLKEDLVRPNHAVVFFVHVEALIMHVFLCNDDAVFVSKELLALLKKLQQVFVCQVTKHPLDPNAIVGVLEFELLKADIVDPI